ncbi:MAG: hypothetical protein KKA42_11660 [candidate division Zixibacteria bacterium]|nr:hypothetical protein [candidate division Zixibacteria bacterium]
MNMKTVLTVILLLFVGASVAFLALQNSGEPVLATAETGAPTAAGGESTAPFVAYYFHGNRRCPTCQKLESYSNAAVTSGFVDQLTDHTLEWQVVNYDEPGNEHYLDDFEMTNQSVVITRVDGGQITDWSNLSQIWELVGDEAEFTAYVQGEFKAFMESH